MHIGIKQIAPKIMDLVNVVNGGTYEHTMRVIFQVGVNYVY